MATRALAAPKRRSVYALLTLSLTTGTCRSSLAPTTHQTPPSSPPPPPTTPSGPVTQRLAFDMQLPSGGPRNIYVIDIDGTKLVLVTSDSADHHAPTIHDSLLAFGSIRAGGSVIASLVTGGKHNTAAVFGSGDAPALSPDGTQLAYLSSVSGTPLVWIAHLDGSQAQRFAAANAGWSGASEAHPVWSPNGDRIAYESTRTGGASIYVGAVAGATGSASLVTTSPTGASVEPSWSPDGTQIVFSSSRNGPTDLFVVAVATGAVTQLTNIGHVGQPTWLHDGRIVFTHWTAGVAGLEWLDPSAPTVVHALATRGDAQHAAAYP